VSSDYGIDPEGLIAEENTATVVVPETLPLYLMMIYKIFYPQLIHTCHLGIQHYMQYILNI